MFILSLENLHIIKTAFVCVRKRVSEPEKLLLSKIHVLKLVRVITI